MQEHIPGARRSRPGPERDDMAGHHRHQHGRRTSGEALGLEVEARQFRHGAGGEGRGVGRGEGRGEGFGRGRRGPGGPRGPRFTDTEPTPVSTEAISAWLTGRLPDGWFHQPPVIDVDRDEIWVVGTLVGLPEGTTEAADLEEGRISRFREETRDQRMAIAQEAEARYDRRVAWGATAGGTTTMFSTSSIPVMTRLRQPERKVLDTLVDAGVARSRSEALAWCVRLVGRNTDDWLGRLRSAMTEVERVREEGPAS